MVEEKQGGRILPLPPGKMGLNIIVGSYLSSDGDLNKCSVQYAFWRSNTAINRYILFLILSYN